jgi:hypothetical protein
MCVPRARLSRLVDWMERYPEQRGGLRACGLRTRVSDHYAPEPAIALDAGHLLAYAW